jgi:hypothetical protein
MILSAQSPPMKKYVTLKAIKPTITYQDISDLVPSRLVWEREKTEKVYKLQRRFYTLS